MRTVSTALVFLHVCALTAQEPAQEKDSPIKVDVDVVNVLATVADKRGALVTDLKQDDFEIREDGKPQQIKYFARETTLPLTIALLLDLSGSVRRFIEGEKETAAGFLKAVLRPEDRAMLVAFSSTIALWQNFTASPELLAANLEQMHPIVFRGIPLDGSPMPATLLYDAVYATAMHNLEGIAGRKVMVIISDGLDNGSRMHIEDAIRAVQSRNTIVYGICFTSGFSGCSFLKNMAEPTGGHMFDVGPKAPLSKIFKAIEDELRSQYSLGYISTNRAHDGSYRKLQVRLPLKKDLKVEARKGYYALSDNQH